MQPLLPDALPLIENMCKGQLLLCVEPAATRERNRGADVCGNYDESLGTFIYMLLNLHLGPLEAKIKYLCCLLEPVACHVGAPACSRRIYCFSLRFFKDN